MTDTATVMLHSVESMSSCDLTLRAGARYVVFARRFSGGVLHTRMCMGTEHEADAAPTLSLLGRGRRTASAPPVIELRLAHGDSAPGRERFLYADSAVWLEREPLLTERTILSAQLQDNGRGDFGVEVTYSARTGRRLEARTRARIGGHAAVLFDGRVASVIPIQGAVGGIGRLSIGAPLDERDALRMRDLVLRRWPPRRAP